MFKKIKIKSGITINTLLMIFLIAAFTVLIVSEKDVLVLNKEIKDKNYAGVGVEIPRTMNVSNWRKYYGGGLGLDSALLFDGPSVRVSTGVDGGWYGGKADIKQIDMTEKSIRFAVRFDDFNAVKTYLVIFASDEGLFDSYFSFNVKNFFADPSNNTWHEIVIDKSDFDVVQGNPDWSKITDVALRVSAESGVYTRVWFGGLSYVENTKEPLITMTFDDGFKSNLVAQDIMAKYEFNATAYVIPQYLEQPNFLTQDDVNYLHESGWEISGHGNTNLKLYSLVDVDTQLAAVHSYLHERNYRGKEHFSYPNGGYTDSIRSLVSEYFDTARTIDGLSQPQGYVIPTKVNAKTVSIVNSADDIKRWVDDAAREKSWLVLTWHDLVENPGVDTEYSIQDFEEVVAYINNTGIKVLPFGEAYAKVIGN